MKYDFYIHGIPKGFEYLGKRDEKDSFNKKYYVNGRGINEFRIEIKTIEKENFYYYSYVIGKDVLNCDKRPGAYFGITVRFDSYYKKALNLYFLLDSFFNSFIYDKVFEQKGKTLIFKNIEINKSFSKESNELKSLIEKTFSTKDLLSLNYTRSDEFAKISVDDANDEEVMAKLSKYGEVSISKEYPSDAINKVISEKNEEISQIKVSLEKEIQRLNNEYEDRFNQLKAEYAVNIDDKINNLNAKQKELNEVKNELESKNKALNNVEEELKKEKEKHQNILNKLFTELNLYLDKVGKTQSNENNERNHANDKKVSSGKINTSNRDNRINEPKINNDRQKESDKGRGIWGDRRILVVNVLVSFLVLILLIILLILQSCTNNDKSISQETLNGNTEAVRNEISYADPRNGIGSGNEYQNESSTAKIT